ncbi:hypothetical protein FisN_9Hh267 [Fistulifera solaris]|uniref:Chloride channel protein n=1 Tax=Fistulifera solaris TaxID=1519565 RepID=A0A1Z5JAY9_FISSO|nr:hypothetical protein FisN_9Hh267 [Fistulifera solaris]|eukprot:GAX11173.1 hypothetical protein FisN_9Hh267 [Fistulifera solaris]
MKKHAYLRRFSSIALLWIPAIGAFQTHFLPSVHRRSFQPRTIPSLKETCLSNYRNGDEMGSLVTNMTEVIAIQPPGESGNTIATTENPIVNEEGAQLSILNEGMTSADASYGDTTSDSSSLPTSSDSTTHVLQFRAIYRDLLKASIIGLASGVAISIFKLAVDGIRHAFYSNPVLLAQSWYRALVPVIGGLLVGCLSLPGSFPPGMMDVLTDVDRESNLPVRSIRTRVQQQLQSLRKSAAAAVTLGTGCSLGPEGPCVELGMSVARSCMDLQANGNRVDRLAWNRMLLSCGAASGVAAGFNAPLSGILFAMEVIRTAFRKQENDASSMLSAPSAIAPVVVSSVLAALVTQRLVGAHVVLHLSHYTLRNLLAEIPLYAVLGTLCGFVAFEFNQFSKFSKDIFQGNRGFAFVRSFMKKAPNSLKPMMGGTVCGILGLMVPGVLFVGYDSINALLNHGAMSAPHLLMLLLTKGFATAISGGSGLVGGTFAPSLFLGAMTGASFYNVVSGIFALFASPTVPSFPLSDLPGFTMVGAASVLAALFRAPLTATMLLFELTHDYKVLLPLMVSAGIGSVVRDILEAKATAKYVQNKINA